MRRRLGALARPRSPSLFYTVTEHPAMLVAMFASPRRMRGGSGCLTGESEERETWTAESLRAAFRAGESLRANGQDETSAVDVSGQHYDRDGEQSPERTEWDLVKRCDLPRSILFNLRV